MGCCISSPAAVLGVDDDAGKQKQQQQQQGLSKLAKTTQQKNELQQQQQQQLDIAAFLSSSASTTNAETKNDALLALIPGRMYANGASNMACMFTQQGRKGTNQDAMLVWEVRDRPELLPSL
jgi:transcription initiation factor TFIID subunit TAF12